MNTKKITILYLLFDILAAILTWFFFFVFRKYNVNPELFTPYYFSTEILSDVKLYVGLVIFPLCWVTFHLFSGYYNKPFRKSRLEELITTFMVTLIGSLIFFFVFILDDIVNNYSDYTKYFLTLFLLQFFLTYIPRLIITTHINRSIHDGRLGFNTVIVGCGELAKNVYDSLTKPDTHSGNFMVGYVVIGGEGADMLAGKLPCLGALPELLEIIEQKQVKEMIIAISSEQRQYIEQIIAMTPEIHAMNVTLKLVPMSQDFLVGMVRTSSIMHEPLITILPDQLPDWQRYTKRFFDVLLSVVAMIILLPVYIFLIIGVKRSSPGPIFYTQERIGYRGRPFMIYKFRSMVAGAEKETPQLSSKDDPRITQFGKFMRKTRLDETPQFINVIKGDMSLVGPRPERQYYIEQIVKIAPYYKLLHNVKPGITSWGQVKFGYAENVEEMIQRLKWDILYLENRSLQMDVKILIYTVLIVLKRKGK
ncbi:MAG: sugar transferase [Bacteroidales bacterium]|nr:sugar transferase [Bacteroidales bacterium]